MMKIKYFIIIAIVCIGTEVLSQESNGRPKAVQELLDHFEPLFMRNVNQVGRIETTIQKRLLYRWFSDVERGIKGRAGGGGHSGVVLAVIISSELNKGGLTEGLIYGAYSDHLRDNIYIEKGWPVLANSTNWRGRPATYSIESTAYRKKAMNLSSNFDSELYKSSWYLSSSDRLSVTILAITFGDKLLKDFSFRIPTSYHIWTGEDFKIFTSSHEVYWTRTRKDTDVETSMEIENQSLRIYSNEEQDSGVVPTTNNFPEMEIWGKMVTKTPSEGFLDINKDYHYSLWVAGEMVSEDFIMHPKENWADHVFEEGYELPKLDQVEAYIKKHKHLPNMPSEKEIIENGYSQHEINVRLLENIEQLTLHKIRQQAEIEESTHQLAEQRKQMEKVRNLLGGGD